MRYADTSVTGAALTKTSGSVLPPMQWRGRFINANTIFFYTETPTYLSLGNKSQFSDCRRIMINPTYGKNLLTGNVNTGKYILCSNMVNYGDYTIKYAYFDFDETKIKILVNTTLHTWDFTKFSWQAGTVIMLRLGVDGTPYIDWPTPTYLNLTNHTTETVADLGNDFVYINAYRDTNGNMVISNADFSYVHYRDGVFGFNDNFGYITTSAVATHHYALAEGEGDIVYDNIGNNDGKLITSSMANARKTYSRIQSYNSLVGFKEDSNIDTAISKAKIPMNKELVLYKSYFSEDNPNLFIKYDATQITQSSLSNTLSIFTSGAAPVMEFCLPLFTPNNEARISELNAGRQFKLSFNIKNATTGFNIKVTDCKCAIGLTYTSSGCVFTELSNIAFNKDEEKTLEIESIPLSDTSFASYIYFYFKFDPSTLPYVSIGSQNLKKVTIELSDIELIQTNQLTSYPAVKNGKNKSEADISYSQLVSDLLPEVSGRWLIPNTWWKPMIQTSSNFGADDGDGWNISARPTALTMKNGWGCNSSNYINYLKNHDTSDLPDGVSYGIDLKTNNYIGNSPSGYFLFNYYNSTTNKIWVEKIFKFKIKFSFWYKLNDVTTNNGELDVGVNFNRLFWLANKNITNTNWHYVEREEYVTIANTITTAYNACLGFSWRGWRDGSTQNEDINDTTYFVGSLADVKYEITPVWDSYRPIYAKMDLDKKELSNIMVYNMKQYGDNLTRIKNHVENF